MSATEPSVPSGPGSDAASALATATVVGPRVRVLDAVGIEGEVIVRPSRSSDRLLLLVLALQAPEPVERAVVCQTVWRRNVRDPDRELRASVSRLRRDLRTAGCHEPSAALVMTRDGVQLRLPTDVQAFRAALGDGRAALRGADHARARALLQDAVALWKPGNAVDGVDDDRAVPGIDRVRRERVSALEGLVIATVIEGGSCPPPVVDAMAEAAAAMPEDERLATMLTVLQATAGHGADARASLDRHRAALADHGLEPSAALRAIGAIAGDANAQASRGGVIGLLRIGLEGMGVEATDSPLAPVASGSLDGRQVEQAWLLQRWAATEASPGLAVVSGPRAVGRTALLGWLGSRLEREGVLVIRRRAPAVDQPDGEAWRELEAAIDPSGSGGDGPLADVLERAALLRPVAVLLDDAGPNPEPVLRVLADAVNAVLAGRVFVVVATDAPDRHDRDGLLELNTLELDPLGTRELARVVRRVAPWLPPDLSREVLEMSAGRPGWSQGAIAGLARQPAPDASSSGVETVAAVAASRALIDEIAAAGHGARELAEVHALGGGTLETAIADRAMAALGVTDHQAAHLELRRLGLIHDAGGGRTNIAPLLASAIRQTCPSWRRAVIHRAVAVAHEEGGSPLDQIAAHRFEAGRVGVERAEAVRAVRAAADHAARHLDHASAVEWYGATRALLRPTRGDSAENEEEYINALIDEGQARSWARWGGSTTDDRADEMLRRATDHARALGSAPLVARALTVVGGDLGGTHRWDQSTTDDLRLLLADLDPDDHEHRTLLHAKLAWSQSAQLIPPTTRPDHQSISPTTRPDHQFAPDAAAQSVRRALDAAELSGRPDLMARAASAYLETQPHDLDLAARDDLANRIVSAGRLLDDDRLVAIGLAHRASIAFLRADGTTLGNVVSTVRLLHERYHLAFALPALPLLRALRGDLAGAEAEIRRQLTADSRPAENDDQYTALLLQLAAVLRFQGRLADFFAGGLTPPASLLEGPGQIAMCVALAELDQQDQARAMLPVVVGSLPVAMHAYPSARLMLLALAAEACCYVGSNETCEQVLAWLEPARGLNCSAWVHAFAGSVTHHVGRLLLRLGRHDEARVALIDAEERHRSLGAHPYLAQTHLALAELEWRDPNGSPARAEEHRRAGLSLAARYQLDAVRAAADALTERPAGDER